MININKCLLHKYPSIMHYVNAFNNHKLYINCYIIDDKSTKLYLLIKYIVTCNNKYIKII